ncbi:MAG: tyrosine--tRNA ligase [Holosporaceae bacterium]|jgi:tyrosyl-tRNA synthetase|nr:tyrosine--tRNA ligase [Holosporaceae bacterium]
MKYKSSFINEAVARGFFYQSTNIDGLDDYLTTSGRLGYIGFDITAKSLHVGSFIQIALLRLFQKHQHKPVVLVGGGTTKVGDPSFRNAARPLLSDGEISENMEGIKLCLLPFLKFGEGESDAVIVNNADWLDELSYIPFLREVGCYFSVNRMIGFDSVKSKLDENNSLSFLEFNYMVMQGYDFYELLRTKDCRIQFGGQDQWGNIVCGVELVRKKLGKEVFGFTSPLLTTKDGRKMGKTANGSIWMLENMLSSYDFWQYWRNVDDADVIRMMYLFTDIDLDEIKKMENIRGQELNDIKVLLADEVTAIVRGRKSLDVIHETATAMFSKGVGNISSDSSVPKYSLKKSELASVSLVDIIVDGGMCTSRGDAKRLLRNGGVYINDQVVSEDYKILPDVQSGDCVKLSCGRKKHLLIMIV